jgi:predicted alpha-1,2-mannosidase
MRQVMNMRIMWVAWLLMVSLSGSFAQAKQPVDYVDPLIGSGYQSTLWYYFSSACRPFGMVSLSPDMVSPDWWGAGYCYHIDTIRGFGHVHDYQVGAVSVMPVVGRIDPAAGADFYGSKHSHAKEVCQAGYHAVTLDRYGVRVELTSTDRVGFHRYTFPQSSHSRVIFNLSAEVVPNAVIDATMRQISDTELEGVQVLGPTNCGRRPKPCSIYFVARFDRPSGTFALCRKKVQPKAGHSDAAPPGAKPSSPAYHAFAEFATKEGDVLQMKVAVSYVSIEQARKNLDAELSHWDFDRIRRESRETWNRWLGRIEVEGGTEQQRTKFYTDLWHVLLGRHMTSDVDGKYCDMTGSEPRVRQIPLDSHGRPKYHHYNSDAFWMTFWNLNEVWGLAYPRVYSGFVNCMVDMCRNGGMIPRNMVGGNYSFEMIAAHSTPLIVGAYMKGIRDFDAELAYAGMRKNHLPGGAMSRGYFEYQSAKGGGLEEYLRYGYIPIDDRQKSADGWIAESGSATMDYAYDDWCLAQMASALGKREDFATFMRRAGNYRKLFDAQTGFMRLRMRDGSWQTPFDPVAEKGWCEGNSSVYTWYVPHDPAGLIRLLGDREAFNRRLNRDFENWAAANYSTPTVNYGNQPCTGMAHLFNYSGAPWLAQKWVYEVKTKVFGGTTPDVGYGGDEDQGQMGGLGVLMGVGLFEVNGGASLDPIYEITTPIFDRVTIHLDPDYYRGGEFVIVAKRSSPAGSGPAYIQSATLNGRPLLKPWFYHRELADGGKLELELGTTPNKQWGSRPEDAPPSMSTAGGASGPKM